MKLAEKILWTCILTIAIVFSLGASFMITQNHHQLLKASIEQNRITHITQTFSLESKLLQDSLLENTSFGQDETAMSNRASYYLSQFQDQTKQSQISYILLSEDGSILLSDIAQSDLQDLVLTDTQHDQRITLNGRKVMLITSTIKAGNITYLLTSCYDLTSIYGERNRQYQTFLIIDLCMLLASFLLIRFLSAYLTKPIHHLNEISRHIAHGNYHERTGIQGTDEIGELSKSFDEMAEVNESTIAALKQNLEQLEAFMGSFSHEIKTPMTAIIGFADMLRSYQCDASTIQTSAQFIFTEGKRLEDLSYRMLELLSLSSTQIERVPLSFLLVIAQLQSYYQHLDQLVFDCEDGIVLANETLLFTLLRNLIDNALKASEGKPISINGKVQQEHYLVSVIDQGIGMNEQQVEQAMQPFYMADPSRKRTHGGAGLGLSICKKIAAAHNSELIITSQLQQGCQISFQLEVRS